MSRFVVRRRNASITQRLQIHQVELFLMPLADCWRNAALPLGNLGSIRWTTGTSNCGRWIVGFGLRSSNSVIVATGQRDTRQDGPNEFYDAETSVCKSWLSAGRRPAPGCLTLEISAPACAAARRVRLALRQATSVCRQFRERLLRPSLWSWLSIAASWRGRRWLAMQLPMHWLRRLRRRIFSCHSGHGQMSLPFLVAELITEKTWHNKKFSLNKFFCINSAHFFGWKVSTVINLVSGRTKSEEMPRDRVA